jgi:hypothetical protein
VEIVTKLTLPMPTFLLVGCLGVHYRCVNVRFDFWLNCMLMLVVQISEIMSLLQLQTFIPRENAREESFCLCDDPRRASKEQLQHLKDMASHFIATSKSLSSNGVSEVPAAEGVAGDKAKLLFTEEKYVEMLALKVRSSSDTCDLVTS